MYYLKSTRSPKYLSLGCTATIGRIIGLVTNVRLELTNSANIITADTTSLTIPLAKIFTRLYNRSLPACSFKTCLKLM